MDSSTEQLFEQILISEYKKTSKLAPLAIKYRIGVNKLKHILEKHGISIVLNPRNKINQIEYEKAYKEYLSKDTIFINDVVHKRYKIHKSSFIKFLKSKNAPIRNFSRAILLNDNYYRCFLDIENAIKIYNRRKCKIDVAKTYNVNPSAVECIFKYAGKPIKVKRVETKQVADKNIQEICDMYTKQNMLLGPIARKLNTSKYYIRKILLQNKIRLKNKIESTKQMNNSIEHQDKCYKVSYRTKPYILPSGAIIGVQGYEPDFLDYIFKQNILNEQEIVNKQFRLSYDDNGKQRHYYPDFYIPKFDLIVEIKSAYTLSKTPIVKITAGKQYKGNYIIIVDKNYTEFTNLIKSYATA